MNDKILNVKPGSATAAVFGLAMFLIIGLSVTVWWGFLYLLHLIWPSVFHYPLSWGNVFFILLGLQLIKAVWRGIRANN